MLTKTDDNSSFFNTPKLEVDYDFERVVLLQVLLISLLGIIFYIFSGLFITSNLEVVVESIGAFIFYAGIASWVYFYRRAKYKKEIVISVLFLSVLSGFFVLGGFNGIAAFDLLNMFLLCSIVFEREKRIGLFVVLVITTLLLVYVQVHHSELIINRQDNNSPFLNYVEILIRIGLSLNIVMAFRNAFVKEHLKVKNLIHEVQELNRDITNQNEELTRMQEELQSNNENLEQQVHIRTQKLEEQNEKLIMYAYMNSHIFRGPISRTRGLLNLMELEKDNEQREVLFQLLTKEIKDVDSVIKDISIMIYEQDQQLMDELKERAKKLYGRQD